MLTKAGPDQDNKRNNITDNKVGPAIIKKSDQNTPKHHTCICMTSLIAKIQLAHVYLTVSMLLIHFQTDYVGSDYYHIYVYHEY
jgi:hypothetical protein